MNSKRLKGKLIEKEMSYNDCAIKLGISITSFCSKINEKTAFKLVEAEKLGEILNLTDQEKVDIFLS
jgi:hypothetical protein